MSRNVILISPDATFISSDAIFKPIPQQEYISVIKLGGGYVAAHVMGTQITFISEKLEIDIKVAKATAHLFAANHHISYNSGLYVLAQPVITVMEHNKKWFPAEVYPDKITLLMQSRNYNFGGNQLDAVNSAKLIASIRETLFIPSI
jgi:hypothetical protein